MAISVPSQHPSEKQPTASLESFLNEVDPVTSNPDDTLEEDSEPPLICVSCLAYFNVYASYDTGSGLWTCPLCENLNAAPPGLLVTGGMSPALMNPFVEYRLSLGVEERDRAGCAYIIVLDENLPNDEIEGVRDTLEGLFLDESSSIFRDGDLVGFVSYGSCCNVYQVGLPGMASADVFPSLSPEEANDAPNFVTAERSYFARTTADRRGGVTTLLQCLTAQLRDGGRGARVVSRKDGLRLRREERRRREGGDRVDGGKGGRRIGKENDDVMTRYSKRCAGTAVRLGIDLATTSSCVSSRILLFTNGCPNFGAGSVIRQESDRSKRKRATVDPSKMSTAKEFYSTLGEEAMQSGIAIDVFCTGTTALGMPAYTSLVSPSSGYALAHTSFASPQFQSNLDHVLRYSTVSRTSPSCGVQLDGAVVDIRTSPFLQTRRIVGPHSSSPNYLPSGLMPCERPVFSKCAALAASQNIPTRDLPSEELIDTTLCRLQLNRYDPLSTLTCNFEVTEDIPPQQTHALIQFITRYIKDNTLFTRVHTHRLDVSESVDQFLEGIEEDIVPVILGRAAVSRATEDRFMCMEKAVEEEAADKAKRDLDLTVHLISSAFRLLGLRAEDEKMSASGNILARSSLSFAFPPQLAHALHTLHSLRRSPLLNPSILSAEDRCVVCNLFLRLPLSDALSIMSPTIFSLRADDRTSEEPTLTPVPPETLVLWDTNILTSDHFDQMFVWSGRSTHDAAFDPLRARCLDVLTLKTLARFPSPHIHILKENDSMSRRFTSRLAPTHLDPPEWQLSHFPDLSLLSRDEMGSLTQKFKGWDYSDDYSFRQWFWGVVSVASKRGLVREGGGKSLS